MADERSPIQFEDVPLDEARRMGRGPRMEPLLYDTLRKKIHVLSADATRNPHSGISANLLYGFERFICKVSKRT